MPNLRKAVNRWTLFYQRSMNFKEFTKKLESHINTRTYDEQLGLAIVICKKLFPDYKNFHQENNWGNPDILLDTIALCEKTYSGNSTATDFTELLNAIELIIPDTEDFGNASYALNASAAVYETLQFIIDKDKDHIMNISSYLTDTIDFKIQEEKDLTEQQINSHPMMVEARNFLIGY